MSEHTPGPWCIEKLDYDCEFEISSGMKLVCTTNPHNALSEANARLIAAAPDMLAALEIAHKLLMADLYCEAEEAIADAIAKARGKA